MTSKLTFRARTLDASKPMAIYNAEDLPELAELNAINRSVPAMPTGMEKEEEAEKHLQDILELQSNHSTNRQINLAELYIPTPEVFSLEDEVPYKKLYQHGYKVPRQYIHVQPFSVDLEKPDYDMNSEDEAFVENVLRKQKSFEIDSLLFEDMIDRLEKNSGQTVVSAKEAKLLLKGDDELILAVYDYWIDKRLRLKHSLMPIVKSDKRDLGISSSGSGSSSNTSTNPYIAFRRRTEKMQTRKNRKNDEASYEKMLKLRRDLSRAVVLLDMIRKREKMKKESLSLTLEVFEKRYNAGDFEGKVLAELQAQKPLRPILQPNQFYANRYAENWVSKHHHSSTVSSAQQALSANDRKRKDKKRKHHARNAQTLLASSGVLKQRNYFPISTGGPEFGTNYHSDEERLTPASSTSDLEEDELEGRFAFRRKANVQYLAPVDFLPFGSHEHNDEMECGGWPWNSQKEGGLGESRYRYTLASLSTPKRRCIGFTRRRIGRGGRVVLDRAHTDFDDFWLRFEPEKSDEFCEFDDWPHYRPVTPPHCKDDWDPDPYRLVLDQTTLGLPTQPFKPSVQSHGILKTLSHQQPVSSNIGRLSALRTVSVDSLGAQNAVTALVSSDTIEMFRTTK